MQLDQAQLTIDVATGAPEASIDQDPRTLEAAADALARAQRAFAVDSSDDAAG